MKKTSSLSVEELKTALKNAGVELPSGKGIKKEDYVKLYEEHVLLNSSDGAAFSDEESPGNSNGFNGNGTADIAIKQVVEALSDDELFLKMKELGLPAGPIVDSTREVYRKKVMSFLQANIGNGATFADPAVQMDPSEISDNEVEIISRERKPTPKRGASREPSLNKQTLPEPRRISFIEKIDRNSSKRIIEPLPELRQRTPVSVGDDYVGKWSPHVKLQKAEQKPAGTTWKRWALGSTVIILIAGLTYLYFLPPADFYRTIEEEIQEISSQN